MNTNEFHISKSFRDRFKINKPLYPPMSEDSPSSAIEIKQISNKMNSERDLLNYPEMTVSTGNLNAMILINEIFHQVIVKFRESINHEVLNKAHNFIVEEIGDQSIYNLLVSYLVNFPPTQIYSGIEPTEYLKNTTINSQGEEISNHLVVLEELILLWLANLNPAQMNYKDLIDDSILKGSDYRAAMGSVQKFFSTQPAFGPFQQDLIEMLKSPALEEPKTLFGQLDYIRKHWGNLIGDLIFKLLRTQDILKEESKIGLTGPGPSEIVEYPPDLLEIDGFSHDHDWMSKLVIITKSTHVWLYQLSQKYQQNITRLDQIPDEELDELANRGITGLWLIGLWERSPASKKIKEFSGKSNVLGSAYSIYNYEIAHDLGGLPALLNLKERAQFRGIRLASDMVPNHMGLDSPWLIENPDWFISSDTAPFPSYTFDGPELSSDPRFSIKIEDHYYDHTDAAVVFSLTDKQAGITRYVYHGNDGTSMPWNDTAQLNYLNPELRGAVIKTIIDVAKVFPIIRFDAAMTLTKKHFQRLWFPEPGSGGAIPSRAEHGLSKHEFLKFMPFEFWRDVVDLVKEEVPDTLLLAEAFWLMEGYFVRSLGMHRVYNSAFMHMLRDEENAKFRQVIKNTIEFDPRILKRFVNFMNNPDEKTAMEQFGGEDKYFGICTLLATLPGLPLIGHGQFEGFREKYGHEFHQPMWDETPNQDLIEEHRRRIFPLLKKRDIFAHEINFRLYDYLTPNNEVNENVIAFSNQRHGERSLLLYNNRLEQTTGWINKSSSFIQIRDQDEKSELIDLYLHEALNIPDNLDSYLLFRNLSTGEHFIRRCSEIQSKGFYSVLNGYECQVFLDFEVVHDDEHKSWARLHDFLDGKGVHDLERILELLNKNAIMKRLNSLINMDVYEEYVELISEISQESDLNPEYLIHEFVQRRLKDYKTLLETIEIETGYHNNFNILLENTKKELIRFLHFIYHSDTITTSEPKESIIHYKDPSYKATSSYWFIFSSLIFLRNLGALVIEDINDSTNIHITSEELLNTWNYNQILEDVFKHPELKVIGRFIHQTFMIMLKNTNWQSTSGDLSHKCNYLLQLLFSDSSVQSLIELRQDEDSLRFNAQHFNTLVEWMFAKEPIEIWFQGDVEERSSLIKERENIKNTLIGLASKSKNLVSNMLGHNRDTDLFGKLGLSIE